MYLAYGRSDDGKVVLMVAEDDGSKIYHRISMTVSEWNTIVETISEDCLTDVKYLPNHEQLI